MRKLWAVPEFVLVAVCWVFGDGHSLGVGNSIPEYLKLTLVLIGWVILIDAFRILSGRRSYTPMLLMILGTLLGLGLCVGLLYWAYTSISIKGFIVLGTLAILAALYCVAREIRLNRQ
jgi:hypothetical protein